MKRTVYAALLVLAIGLVSPRSASADAWGWLEQFSGPGPFQGYPVQATVCPLRRGSTYVGLFGNGSDAPTPRRSCFYIDDGRDFHTVARAPFPAIDVETVDIGGSIRFFDFVDVGAGFGYFRFSPEGRDSTTKFAVTPFRLVMHPAVMAFDGLVKKTWARELLGAPAVYWKGTFVYGTFTGETFGARASAFHSDSDFVESAGFVIDGYALGQGLADLIRHPR